MRGWTIVNECCVDRSLRVGCLISGLSGVVRASLAMSVDFKLALLTSTFFN